MNGQTFTSHSVYTIAHCDRLESAIRRNRPVRLTEGKRWVTAVTLFEQAQLFHQEMPILFGDAADCTCLVYWGILKDINLNPIESGTTFVAGRIRRFAKHHAPQELILRSSRRAIAPNFIRPYAICFTPHFLDGSFA